MTYNMWNTPLITSHFFKEMNIFILSPCEMKYNIDINYYKLNHIHDINYYDINNKNKKKITVKEMYYLFTQQCNKKL